MKFPKFKLLHTIEKLPRIKGEVLRLSKLDWIWSQQKKVPRKREKQKASKLDIVQFAVFPFEAPSSYVIRACALN